MARTDTPSTPSSSRFRRAALLLALPAGFLLRGAPGAAQQQPPPPAAGTTQGPAQIIIGGASSPRLAVPDCIPRRGDDQSREACRTITQVLRNDLKFEGVFQFVPDNLLTAIPAMNPDSPNFKDWESIGANVLVVTRAEAVGSEMNVEVKVHFVSNGQSMLAKRYNGRAENPRLFAHQASDDIVALTQYKGVARSKIAFVSDRDASKERRTKEIYIVDYDGFNPRRVTVNGSINILPTWSGDGRSLAYVSYRQESTPNVYLASIFEGKSSKLTSGGQSFAPSFSPDGKRIAYSSNRGGNMDIWVANADGTGAKKITSSAGLDTAPCWSPTGQEIAFTSGRGGTPQIYIMDSEGLNVRRLTNVGNWNDAPSWNPSKEFSEIAYTARIEGGFEVAVIDFSSGQIRQISQGRGSCEYPSWAPNGRHLVFSCNRGGTWQITVSDRDGRSVQTLAAGPGNNVYPDWGP